MIWKVVKREDFNSFDQLWLLILCNTQKSSGLAELGSVIIKELILEIQACFDIVCHLLACFKYDTSSLFCINECGINMATRLENCLTKVIFNITVLQNSFETLQSRSIYVLVVDEQEGMLCMCRPIV